MPARAILMLIVFAAWAVGAQAQTAPPRFEVGAAGGASVALAGASDGFLILTLGPRLTFNTTSRDAIEVVAEMVGPVENDGLNGLYLLQYKRILRERNARRNQVFVTAGFGGSFEYQHVDTYRWERPDGSVFVEPAYTHASVASPFLGAMGVGIERVVARFLATRSEVQVLMFRFGGVGIRGTFGVSVPIGGYRVR